MISSYWRYLTTQGSRFALLLCALMLPLSAMASSHREAPLISQDPSVDQTDLYAYVNPQNPDNLVLAATYYPLMGPGAGPNYYNLSTDAVYAIHIDNDGDAEEDVTYAITVDRLVKNEGTFLYNLQPLNMINDSNVTYNYNVYRIPGRFTMSKRQLGRTKITTHKAAPPVIGSKSIADYDKLAREAVSKVDNQSFFVGPRDDPFFVDLKVFDLLNLGGGVDSLKGANVQAFVAEVPIKMLTGDRRDALSTSEPVLGVWGAVYRPSRTVLRASGERASFGAFRQVSRLGHPLVNEVVVPLQYKDYFNSSHPKKDADTQPYVDVVMKPELAGLLKAVLGLDVPTDNRTDLVTVFLTGGPSLNQPKNVRAAEILRVNTSIAPTNNQERLGVFGGDLAGFPNGRRLADDVTDIAIQAVAGKLVDGYNVPAELGDGVNQNDKPFLRSFPYLASPHK